MYKVELIASENMKCILPLLKRLNPSIELATLEVRVQDMMDNNYQCVGVYDDAKLAGISGI